MQSRHHHRRLRWAITMVVSTSSLAGLVGLVGLVGLGAGCAAFETNLQDTTVTQKDTARQNFESAEKAFEGRRFNEAVKYFEIVKNKFPYSKYAVLAELRLADTHFEREKWLEAADSYRIFVRFHPRHEQVTYAAYRVALAHSRAIENNVAWLPFVDAREKDQSSARDTIRACNDFLTRYPDDEHAAEVQQLRAAARTRLAEVDLYAASFYEEREKWQGAMWRYLKVGDDYPDSDKAAWALLRAGQICEGQLQDTPQARLIYERVEREHPESDEATEARAALARLPSSPPPKPADQPASDSTSDSTNDTTSEG